MKLCLSETEIAAIEGAWPAGTHQALTARRSEGGEGVDKQKVEGMEEALEALREEVQSRTERYESVEKIMSGMAKREELLTQRADLARAEQNPDRLRGRGASAVFAECKLRDRIKTELPKRNAALRARVAEWHEAHPYAESGFNPAACVRGAMLTWPIQSLLPPGLSSACGLHMSMLYSCMLPRWGACCLEAGGRG